MKKILILLIIFYILLSSNVFADTNTDNFAPKKEISDAKKSKKINSIQKFILKKTLKKLQKQALNPQNSKKKKSFIIMGVLIILGAIFGLVIGGIQLIIAGSVLTGIILTMLGLIGAGLFVLYVIRSSKSTD